MLLSMSVYSCMYLVTPKSIQPGNTTTTKQQELFFPPPSISSTPYPPDLPPLPPPPPPTASHPFEQVNVKEHRRRSLALLATFAAVYKHAAQIARYFYVFVLYVGKKQDGLHVRLSSILCVLAALLSVITA